MSVLSMSAQCIECPPSCWEVMGSIPVGGSDFFFVPCFCHVKKLQVARKNCSVERTFCEATLTHISLNYSIVIISYYLFYFVHSHQIF